MVNAETRELIRETVDEALEKFCKKMDERIAVSVRLHAAECPGRTVGKGALTALLALVTAVGAGVGAVVVKLFVHD